MEFLKGEKYGELIVEVIEARNLHPMDSNGTSDPYVIVIAGNKKMKTKIIYNTLNPVWTVGDPEIFTFTLSKKVKQILFECYDWDKYTADDRQGQVKISVEDLLDYKEHDAWHKLEPMKQDDFVAGDLHLKIKLNKKENGSKLKTPLFGAIKKGDTNAVSNILSVQKVDISDLRDANGSTPLHIASAEGNTKVLMALLKNPNIKVDAIDSQGNTAFHVFAAKFPSAANYQDIMTLYLSKLPSVDIPNSNGDTPLHKAVFNPAALPIMEFLLVHGANPSKTNKAGETAMQYSVRLGRADLCGLLLQYGGSKDLVAALKLAQELKNNNVATFLKHGQDVLEWLDKIGLQSLGGNFIKNEVYLDLLPDLDEAHLAHMGIKDPAQIHKILDAAKEFGKPGNARRIKKEDKTVSKMELHHKLKELKYTKIQQRATATWLIADEELEFGEKLGKGASGSVYRGKYVGEEVAIKVLPTVEASDLQEFQREFQVISALQSPYAVKFYGVSIKNRLSIVMEFCSRGSIYNLLQDLTFDFGWQRFFHFALGTVYGINSLHSWKPPIMHRDLKSLNLLVTDSWAVKVCDFGLSRFDTSSNLKTLSKLRGTFCYVAPEVYFGEKFTTKSDVYSIGILLWEMVNRCITKAYLHPFEEYPELTMDFQILIAATKKNQRPTTPASCPQELKDLIANCVEREPAKRPTTEELTTKLKALEEQYKKNQAAWDKAIVGK